MQPWIISPVHILFFSLSSSFLHFVCPVDFICNFPVSVILTTGCVCMIDSELPCANLPRHWPSHTHLRPVFSLVSSKSSSLAATTHPFLHKTPPHTQIKINGNISVDRNRHTVLYSRNLQIRHLHTLLNSD